MSDTTESPASNPEQMSFQAEVSQLMQLMIHSLYSNQEIFLRELISNGSDACDKLRFEAIANNDLYENDSELKLHILFDEEASTITVRDNGIGMNRDDVISNIGTIAKSGTKQFLESLTGDQKVDSQLIGQFGVGFYSAFVVADKVELTTRKAGDTSDKAVRWTSDGSGGFTLEDTVKEERGTDVVLHIKEDSKQFVNGWQLRSIVKKYSDHITFPIMMLQDVPPPAEDAEEEQEPVTPEFEQINAASALWTRPKSQVSDDEYDAFYKQVCQDYESPLAWTHNRVEGTQEYTTLLYIPKKAPFDLFDAGTQRNGIKLFVQRVFIMDEAEKLMPRYLRFVRGIVDSNDLPLNVSREILQDSKVIDSIRRASVQKVLGLLEKMADKEPEKYAEFWTEFGQCLKEAPGEDFANKEQVAKLYRFDTSNASKAGDSLTSLDDYIARMQPSQDKIYYITGDSYNAASNSPHLEVFRDKKIEVLLMHDRVDEWMMSYLNEYDGKSFVSVAKGDLDLSGIGLDDETREAEKKAKEEQAAQAEPLLKRIKEVLENETSDVRASTRLTSSPACVVLGEHEMAMHMQQLMKQAGHEVPSSKPVLEVNPSHPILQLLDQEPDDDQFASWSRLLLDQALLAEGGQLEDSAGFVKRMNEMFMALHQG